MPRYFPLFSAQNKNYFRDAIMPYLPLELHRLRAALFTIIFVCVALGGCSSAREEGVVSGYVEAEYVYISTLESGWIKQSKVTEGDRVEVGQTLFILDTERQQFERDEALQQLAQAEAQLSDMTHGARPEELQQLQAQRMEAAAALTLAKIELKRISSLNAKGAASQSSFDTAQAQAVAAKARLQRIDAEITVAELGARKDQIIAADSGVSAVKSRLARAQWRLDQRRVNATRAGRVESLYFHQGEQLAAGRPALAILPDDGLKVRFFVPQAGINAFAVGDVIELTQDGLTAPLSATVSYIAEQVEFTPPVIYSVGSREKLVFMLEAKLPSGSGLHPGQPVDVTLP
ncbi:MAG: HlyD family secretion protein [Zhongshania sp.]|jgi:HlyD family secretion protein